MSAQNTPFNPLTEPETATTYETNMVITTLSFPSTVVYVTRQTIYHKDYSQQQQLAPVGDLQFTINPEEGCEFVTASKRDSNSYFVLSKYTESKTEFLYQIYSVSGQLQGQTKVAREILQAQAIEGTPIVACSHILRQSTGFTGKAGQVMTFSFDVFLPTGNQGVVFKAIRLAKAHSDATDFIQTVYYNCIRVTEPKAIICARKPCCNEQQFAQLALETEIKKDQAALLLSCVHLCSGKTQLIYRDYVFKVRSGKSYELMCEITKQMTYSAAGTPVARLIGFSCGAGYTSLLYNSFGAVTAYGDLLVYQFNKQQPVQKVRLQQQTQFVTLCNFNNSLLCVADGDQVTFYGVDGQFNDFPGLQKLYQQLCTELAPVIAQVADGSEESAKYLCQMNLIPQVVFQQLNLEVGTRILNPLTRITLPFQVSQISADARNLIISGRGRTLLFQLDQLRNQFKYDYLVQKCGDFLGNFCSQCNIQAAEALQILQQKGLLSNQPIQDALIDPDNASEATTLAATAQTPLTATNQLRASSPVHNIDDILAENHFDELSALRNSQADVPAGMTGTRGLIELGNLVANQDWGSQGNQVQNASRSNMQVQSTNMQNTGSARNLQASFNGNDQLLSRGGVSMSQYAAGGRSAMEQQSNLQSQALEAARQANESMSQQLATRESQLKRSQELLSQLFGSLAQSGVETLDLQHLSTINDAQAFLGEVAGVFRGVADRQRPITGSLLSALDKCLGPELSYAIAKSCAFRPAQGVKPSTEAVDQQFYHGNQIFKLFQVVFESNYLLPCGHVSKKASSRIVLDLMDIQGSNPGSRSGSPTSGSSGSNRRDSTLQSRLMALFRNEFVSGDESDQIITCKQCKQQASVDACHEELYGVQLPMKLIVFGDAPLLQRLQFELNGVEHSYVLQAVIADQSQQIFSLDEHGDWYDALQAMPADFSAIQQRFNNQKCFAVYTKPAVNDVRLSQETFKAIVQAYGSAEGAISGSNARKMTDQLSHELSQIQRHDAESQKIIQNQTQTIQKLQLQLKDIQESLRAENISELSLADLIRQNTAFRQENDELKVLTSEQEKQINVLVAENEQLQQQLSTKMTSYEAEQVVRQCLELMGARNIPRYGEELFRQLQNQCMAVQAERKILRSGDIATSGPGSLLNSQNIISNYTGNKCYECLLPSLAVIFALVLVGLFALVLMDSL